MQNCPNLKKNFSEFTASHPQFLITFTGVFWSTQLIATPALYDFLPMLQGLLRGLWCWIFGNSSSTKFLPAAPRSAESNTLKKKEYLYIYSHTCFFQICVCVRIIFNSCEGGELFHPSIHFQYCLSSLGLQGFWSLSQLTR